MHHVQILVSLHILGWRRRCHSSTEPSIACFYFLMLIIHLGLRYETYLIPAQTLIPEKREAFHPGIGYASYLLGLVKWKTQRKIGTRLKTHTYKSTRLKTYTQLRGKGEGRNQEAIGVTYFILAMYPPNAFCNDWLPLIVQSLQEASRGATYLYFTGLKR